MDQKTPKDRLFYTGPLKPVLERACVAYRVGALLASSILTTGYEDCNCKLQTAEGTFVAKVFSKLRTEEVITRYVHIMEQSILADVHHPELFRTNTGSLLFKDQETGLSMVLMQFIQGKTFLDLDRAPTSEERTQVLAEAAKINKIDHHPVYLFDAWAIPHIETTFEKVRDFMSADDRLLVEEVIHRYKQVPTDSLAHCFVHGDFTKANVIKGDDGKIYILDFSVANWYPRIQELTIIVENLHYNRHKPVCLAETCALIANEYSVLNPLAPEERLHLPTYALAGAAMEFIGSHQEKFVKGHDNEETAYWLNLGRTTLRTELL